MEVHLIFGLLLFFLNFSTYLQKYKIAACIKHLSHILKNIMTFSKVIHINCFSSHQPTCTCQTNQ